VQEVYYFEEQLMAKQVRAIDSIEQINLIQTMAQSANLGILVIDRKRHLGWVSELRLVVAGGVQ